MQSVFLAFDQKVTGSPLIKVCGSFEAACTWVFGGKFELRVRYIGSDVFKRWIVTGTVNGSEREILVEEHIPVDVLTDWVAERTVTRR